MKKSVLIIALGLGLGLTSAPAFAYDYGHNNRFGYVSRSDRLDYQIRQVDRQLDRVRSQLRRNGADWRIRRDVSNVSRQFERVKWQYRTGSADRYRLYRELERIRYELDRVQDRLQHRGGDYDRWNR
jgi:hypothetical protein